MCSGCYPLLGHHSTWCPEVEETYPPAPLPLAPLFIQLHKPDGIPTSNYNILLDLTLTCPQTHPPFLISLALTVIPVPTNSPGLLQGPPAFSLSSPHQFQSTLQNQATTTSSKYIQSLSLFCLKSLVAYYALLLKITAFDGPGRS